MTKLKVLCVVVRKLVRTGFKNRAWEVIIKVNTTCPYNEYPFIPNFYIVKLGFTGVYIIFLFLLLNIVCGYSLEPSNEYPQSLV